MKEKIKPVGAGLVPAIHIRNTQKGITLIALIISIIVLLILTIVSIKFLENTGIIERAKQGVIKHKLEEIHENVKLRYTSLKLGGNLTRDNMADEINDLKENQYSKYIEKVTHGTNRVFYQMTDKLDGKEYYIDIATGEIKEYVDELAKVTPTDASLWKKEKTATGYKIIGYTGTGEQLKDVVVPNVFIENEVERPVTEVTLNNIAFEGKITISSNVEITNTSFTSCESLTEVTIGDNVILNGGGPMSQFQPFDSCTNLKKVIMGKNIQIKTSDNRYTLFMRCPQLEEIRVESLDYIGGAAFMYAKSALKGNIVINEGLTSIGESAFNGCSSITSVIIPRTVTSIGASAFYNCKEMKVNSIPNTIDTIGNNAFNGCEKLKLDITIKAGISLGEGAFNNSGITKLVIENGISVPNNSFMSCNNLTEVTIGDNVILNGGGAMSQFQPFDSCTNLKKVIMGKNIQIKTSDNRYTLFMRCPQLEEIRVESLDYIGGSAFIYAKSALKGNIVINEGVTSIGESAFNGCSSITSVTIPSTVTSVGNCAFQNCAGLKTINVNMTEEEWNNVTKGNNWNKGITATITYKQ